MPISAYTVSLNLATATGVLLGGQRMALVPRPSLMQPLRTLRARRALGWLGALAIGLTLTTPGAAGPSTAGPSQEPLYPLDTISRSAARGAFQCPEVDLVDYRGDGMKYAPYTRVFSGFRDRLKKFEQVVEQVARETYGRPPLRIVNLGSFNCRRMTTYATWISEHGLGNAIDVAGFDFGPLPKGATLPAGLPATFRNGFEVRVQPHWSGKTRDAAIHGRFLKTFARRLIGRKDVFRVLLGPGYPGHQNHFHFDMAPFTMVQIFEDGQILKPLPAPTSP
jgi:hypothetical protein